MTTLSHSYRTAGPLTELAGFVRHSRSLASMLPSLLTSGVLTLVISALMHLIWSGLTDGFIGRWMENWLTAWPIAFPAAYLAGPALLKLAAAMVAPVIETPPRRPGLSVGDITDASMRITAKNGFTVRRRFVRQP